MNEVVPNSSEEINKNVNKDNLLQSEELQKENWAKSKEFISKSISNLRWCVDKKNDLDLVRFLVQGIESRPILTKDILQFLNNKSNLKELNKDHIVNEGYLKSLQEDKEFLRKI